MTTFQAVQQCARAYPPKTSTNYYSSFLFSSLNFRAKNGNFTKLNIMTSIEVKYRGHIDFKLKLYFTNQPYRFQKYPKITKIPTN